MNLPFEHEGFGKLIKGAHASADRPPPDRILGRIPAATLREALDRGAHLLPPP
jgi:hypothetical protein